MDTMRFDRDTLEWIDNALGYRVERDASLAPLARAVSRALAEHDGDDIAIDGLTPDEAEVLDDLAYECWLEA
jgi:hypothetical protein